MPSQVDSLPDDITFSGGTPVDSAPSDISFAASKPDSATDNAKSYLAGSVKAGFNDLLGAGAKLIDAANPFTLSDEDAAVLYRNDPAKLKQMRDQSAAMALSRYAREKTDASNQDMKNISPGAKAAYGGLKYATTDAGNSAFLSPVKLAGDAIRSLPTTAALAATAYLTRGASIKAETQAIASGASAEAARTIGIKAASETAAKAGAISEGSIGYAQQALQTQNQIENMPQAKLAASPAYQSLITQGYTPQAARIYLAAHAGEQSGAGAGVVDAVTNAVGGQFLGKIIGEGGALVPRIGKGFLNEGVVEGIQSPGEQLAQNIAIQQNADPSQSLTDGLAENALQGLAVGGLTGGAVSGAVGRAHNKQLDSANSPPTTAPATPVDSVPSDVTPATEPTQTPAKPSIPATTTDAVSRLGQISGEESAINARLDNMTPEYGYGPEYNDQRTQLHDHLSSLAVERNDIAKAHPAAIDQADKAARLADLNNSFNGTNPQPLTIDEIKERRALLADPAITAPAVSPATATAATGGQDGATGQQDAGLAEKGSAAAGNQPAGGVPDEVARGSGDSTPQGNGSPAGSMGDTGSVDSSKSGTPDSAVSIDAAAHEAATSPHNDIPQPTEAQKLAGNYKLGHINLHGLDISIENPAGSTRSGVDENGKPWETTLANHYGYLKAFRPPRSDNGITQSAVTAYSTKGADGDQLDVFIGDKPESQKVYVVDQVNPNTGAFDEHKILLGFDSQDAALNAYHANYQKGWRGAKSVTGMSMDQFKDWLKNGDKTKPIANPASAASTSKVSQIKAEMAAAYGDSGMVLELFESANTDIKAIGDALREVAGRWASMRDMAKSEAIDPQVDTTGNLMEAVQLIRKARAEGKAISDLAGQGDLMSGTYIDPLTEGWLRIFYRGQDYAKANSKDRVITGMMMYIDGANATRADAGLFGEDSRVTPGDMLKSTQERVNEQFNPQTTQGGLFSSGGKPAGQSAGRNEPQDGGRVSPPGGQETGSKARQEGQSKTGQGVQAGKQGHENPALAGEVSEKHDVIGSIGKAPNNSAPITVVDGVIQIDGYPAQNFDTGEDITVPAGYDFAAVKKALIDGGAVASSQKVFAAHTEKSAPVKDSVPVSNETILTAGGKPFGTQGTAEFGLKARKLGATHHVVPVEGGFAIVPFQSAPETSTGDAQQEDGKLPRGGASIPTDASGANPLAVSPPNAGAATTMTPGQSSDSNIANQDNNGNDKAKSGLESFGDKVTGRRDSYRKAYSDKMEQAATEDVAAVPLSKSWPEPDYVKLLEDGDDPWGVAFIHAARDEIPSKPGSAFKQSRWVEQVKQLRDMANNILSGKVSSESMKTLLDQDKFRVLRDAVGSRADLYEAVGHDKSLKGVTVSSGRYGIFEGKEYNPPKVFWSVQQKAKATAFSNWPRMLAFADTREAAITAFKQKLDGLELNKPSDKTVSFDLYSYRGKPGVWIGKKVGKGYIDLKHFDDTKAARAYLSGNQAELEALLTKKKEIPNERRDSNLPRVGADHRNGQDVTPEMFNDTFGFKGVRFGDTMPNAERIANLNQTYDALMDMAGVIGVPPKALSLNGELNIAFGALGTGGKKAAAAHYETDTVVINLTRKNGPGSLAHEWFHAVDNYFSRMRGKKSAFTTEALDVSLAARNAEFMANTAIRKEMIEAFGGLVKAINTGNFIARSRALDARRSKPYWSTKLEMAARTFESYVIAKLQDQGASNDYLANVVSKEYWDAKEALGMENGGTYPYPTAEEMPAVRAAFDNFFNVVETKETDTGTTMFSRSADIRAAAWKILAGDMDMFQNPTPDSFNMESAAREINPRMRALADKPDLDEEKTGITKKWLVTMPDKTHAFVYENDKNEVWLDASRLGEGISGGTKLYQLVGSYAEANGKVFIGDPAGLSDVALLRRTENMLSLALRYGKTDFIQPHEYQMNPSEKLDSKLSSVVRPINWVPGDDENNLKELIKTSYTNTLKLAPEIRDVTYNFDKQRFELDGREFADEKFKGISNKIAEAFRKSGLRGVLDRASQVSNTLAGLNDSEAITGKNEPRRQDGVAAGQAQAGNGNNATDNGQVAGHAADVQSGRIIGSATLKRVALTNTMAREARSGRGRQLLAQISGIIRGGLKDTPIAGSLYSRAPDTSNTIHLDDLNAVTQRFRTAFPGLPVHVLEDESFAPKSLRDDIASAGADGGVAGAYHNGEVYLFQSGIHDIEHAEHTALHEATHAGLQKMFGDGINMAMLNIHAANQAVKTEANQLREKYGYSAVTATQEVLADMGPAAAHLKGWDKLVAWARSRLRKFGFVKSWTDNDVAALVLSALKAAKSGQATHVNDGSMFQQHGESVEFRNTERTIGGKLAYDAAKAAGKTKLGYRQWVQVRTPSFKTWWGSDWEKEAGNESKTESVVGRENGSTKSSDSAGKNTGITGRRENSGGISAVHQGIADSETNQNAHIIGRREDASRDSEVRAIGSTSTTGNNGSSTAQSGQEFGGMANLLRGIFLDPQTGEPRVFYHGTTSDFSEFESEGLGAHFTADSKVASDFAEWKPDGGNVMPVYLNIRNPLRIKDHGGSHADARGVAESMVEQGNLPTNYVDDAFYERLMQDGALGNSEKYEQNNAKELTRIRNLLEAKGYDGLVYNNTTEGGGDALVPFHSWQVKSATGNNGNFDASNPNTLFSRKDLQRSAYGETTPEQTRAITNVVGKPKTLGERLREFKQDWQKNLVQGIVDQYAPIRDYSMDGYIQARMTKASDSTLEAVFMYGKPVLDENGDTKVEFDKDNGAMNGFASVMAKLDGEHDRFLLWVAAQRAERLNDVGLENLFSAEDIKALKTLNQGNLQNGQPRLAAYATALKGLNDYNDAVLKIAAERGLINDATRKMYKDMPYVPFYRLREDDTVQGFTAQAGLVNKSAWKKLKGGTAQLNEDLLANTLQNWSHLITASAQNRAAKSTLLAAAKQGAATEVPASYPGKNTVKFKDNVVRTIPAGKTYIENGEEKLSHGDAQIEINVERKFVVEDAHLMDAIASLGQTVKVPLVMRKFKYYLTIGVTINPSFKLRNLMRDTIQSMALADLSMNPLKNIHEGIKATGMHSEVRAQMLAGGGIIRFGSMLDGNSADLARELITNGVDKNHILDDTNKVEWLWKHWIKPAFDAYQEFGDRGEQVNRAALYQRLIAKGMTHGEAAFWARDLMDFSMSGKWAAVRYLTQTVPFMNARLQGLYKLGRSGIADKKRFGYVVGGVVMASLMLLGAYHDDEDWKKREDWDRDNYWWFKVGGTAFRIPKPFEIGAVGTLAERGVELMTDDEMTRKRFIGELGNIVSNQLSMNPTPQLVKPLIDLWANKDSFSGRPIETMGMDNLKPEDRFGTYTTGTAKLLGEMGLPNPAQLVMGNYDALSPVQIDFMVRSYFGWLGTATTTALEWGIFKPLSDSGADPSMKLKDVFFVGNFAETLPSNSSRYVTQMYNQAKEIEQAYGSYRAAMKDGDTARAESIMAEDGDKLRKYRQVEAMKRIEGKISMQIKIVTANKTMSADDKRAKIDELNQKKDEIARRFSVPN